MPRPPVPPRPDYDPSEDWAFVARGEMDRPDGGGTDRFVVSLRCDGGALRFSFGPASGEDLVHYEHALEALLTKAHARHLRSSL